MDGLKAVGNAISNAFSGSATPSTEGSTEKAAVENGMQKAKTSTGVTLKNENASAPISGYPESGKNSWRSQNDKIFNDAVQEFNSKYGYEPGNPAAANAKRLKAQAMVESGSSMHKEVFLSEPLQVNYNGDWVDKKKEICNLEKGEKMTPAKSASAALEWLDYKGWKYDSTGNKSEYMGVEKALRNYTGNVNEYDTHPGQQHRDWYSNKVLELSGEKK
jgi:hypothetical protein